jgi:hypothetical protein
MNAVLARNFTKGKVLYYAGTWAGVSDFTETLFPVIDLQGSYRRVHYDGTMGEVITEIQLFGSEGAILWKVPD